MGVKERLLLFISEQGLKKSEFERKAKLSNGYVNKLKGAIGDEKLRGILSAFPDISRVWLLTGEGPMLRSAESGPSAPGAGRVLPYAPQGSTVAPQGSTVEGAGQYPTADRVVPCSPDVREVINRIFKGNEGLALEFLKKAQEFPSAPFIARQLCRLQKEEKIRYFSIHGDKKRFYSWLKANKALEGNRVNFTKRLIDKGVR